MTVKEQIEKKLRCPNCLLPNSTIFTLELLSGYCCPYQNCTYERTLIREGDTKENQKEKEKEKCLKNIQKKKET